MSGRIGRLGLALVVAVALLVLVVRLASPGTMGASAADPTLASMPQAAVMVSGTATVEIVPDIARVIFNIQTTATTATQAESENAATTASVRNRILGAGIADADIKTLSLQVWAQYDYRTSPSVLTGFMATQTLQVTIHDLRKIGSVIDAGVAGGATGVQGISYDVVDHTAATEKALALAVKDAQGKARAMADAAGIRLGSVVSMTDVQSSPYPFPVFAAAAPSAGSPTQVSPPNVQLTVNITVGWSIA
jgi:uncharacterized protein YggE